MTAAVGDINAVPSPQPSKPAPVPVATEPRASPVRAPSRLALRRQRTLLGAARRPRGLRLMAYRVSTLLNLAVLAAVTMAVLGFDGIEGAWRQALAINDPIAGGVATAAAAKSPPGASEPVAAPTALPDTSPGGAPSIAAGMAPVPAPDPAADGAPSRIADTATAAAELPAAAASPTVPVAGPVAVPVAGPVAVPVAGPVVVAAAPPAASAVPAAPPSAPATEAVAAPAPLEAERQHLANFDALIAPVRDAPFSLEDATRLRDAFVSTTSVAQVRALRDQLKEPAARKLIDWALARGGNAGAREIKSFLAANPEWPSRDALTARAEEQLFTSGGSARDIRAFFDTGAPKTGIGMAALASAFLAEGDEVKAASLAAAAWRRSDIPSSLETGFLERFGRLLKPADHKARFDTYLIDNTRWMPDRGGRAAVARRLLPLLGEAERKRADARLAAYLRLPTADAALAALPTDTGAQTKPDWGLAFQLAQVDRRAGRMDAAWKILRDVPANAAEAGNLDEWWEERRVEAYAALKAGKPELAYDLVKAPGSLSVNQAKDQTFLAGWIALRYLKNTALAEQQFKAFEAVADGPLSRAKAAYWLARAYEAQGPAGQATSAKMRPALERAARNTDTFYGQLARLELDPSAHDLMIVPPRAPSPEEARHFNQNDLVRAAVLSRKANLDRGVTRALLGRLSLNLDNEAEQGLLAHLAEALGDTQMAVHIGKAGIARGFNLLLYSYPIHGLPAYTAIRPPIEPALMLAITRQETEFDDTIVSGAGARGLMQVMKVTAEQVCHDYRFKCELDRLSRDPAYNVMMASAYIADRLDEFRGSYVLTIPGYNAGPGRVHQWMKEFGDPRTSAIDPLDWIHRIPFEETREYVQKVLSNLQVYRARLGGGKNALRLLDDLHRAGPGPQRRATLVVPTAGAAPDVN